MEPIMHFLIPLLILLVAFPKLDRKLVFLLAFLALVPDLDFFIDFTHRFLFHNIFFVLILSLVIYFFSKDVKIFLISLYYLMSHLILDLTIGSLALFWPLYQRLIEVTIFLNSKWEFVFKITTHPLNTIGEYMTSRPSYFFTQEGIIVIILLITMLIIRYWKEIKKFIGIHFLEY
jgi:hypothetical protein